MAFVYMTLKMNVHYKVKITNLKTSKLINEVKPNYKNEQDNFKIKAY